MESISDNALMIKVKEGDLEKLGFLFERYHKVLFSFFYRMNSEPQLSEDLVQNVFMRILKYKHAFKGDGEFKTWMFHIARNINYDHYRKESKRGYKEDLEGHGLEVSDYEEQQLEEEQDRNMSILKHAIERLPQEKREILTLSKLQGMKYRDIGALMDCSEGAIKVKVFRALNDLKKEFEKIKTSYE